jgi:predicted phage-related endonuclease
MDDAHLMRNLATQLFALAERSRQQGHSDYAEELESLAGEVVRHAVAIERHYCHAFMRLAQDRKNLPS